MSLTHRSVDLGSLLIDVSVDDDLSDVMDFRGWRSGAKNITIYGPSALTQTNKVQVSADWDGTSGTWNDLSWPNDGSDVTIPAAGTVVIESNSWNAMRISAGGAEAADREFIIRGEEGN